MYFKDKKKFVPSQEKITTDYSVSSCSLMNTGNDSAKPNITYYLPTYMEQNPYCQITSHSVKFTIPLLHSQDPTTDPYAMPDASSLHLPTQFP